MRKSIIIATDGTWNTLLNRDGDKFAPTNVVKFCRALADYDKQDNPQIRYYHPGVGTAPFSKMLGGATGWGLSANAIDAYRFLCRKYSDGDKVFLIGFSRGAYTARTISGLIGRFGILRPEFIDLVPNAYKLYRECLDYNATDIKEFRQTFGRENVSIEMIGVWDTVGALGIPGSLGRIFASLRRSFHDVKLGNNVRGAYHAIAIDERRSPFKPTLWEVEGSKNQIVQQTWFAGVHSNIGGGYKDSGLSDITLRWMIEKAKTHGLRFDEEYTTAEIRPNSCSRLRDSLSFKYKYFFQNKPRQITTDKWAQSIDQTVYERINSNSLNYRPSNIPDQQTFDF